MDHLPRAPRIVDLEEMARRQREALEASQVQEDAATAPNPAGERRTRSLALGGALLAVGLGLPGNYLHATEPGRALRSLPAAERAALYDRTMANLREVCEPVAPRALRAYCKAQAAVVLERSECDEACREIARRHLTQPTR